MEAFFIVLFMVINMVVALSAEPYTNGLRDYYKNRPFERAEVKISDKLWNETQQWYEEYQRFVSMTLNELEPHWNQIEDLDKKGVELLKKIASEWVETPQIEKFYYLSFCNEKFSFVVYPSGIVKEL